MLDGKVTLKSTMLDERIHCRYYPGIQESLNNLNEELIKEQTEENKPVDYATLSDILINDRVTEVVFQHLQRDGVISNDSLVGIYDKQKAIEQELKRDNLAIDGFKWNGFQEA